MKRNPKLYIFFHLNTTNSGTVVVASLCWRLKVHHSKRLTQRWSMILACWCWEKMVQRFFKDKDDAHLILIAKNDVDGWKGQR